MSLCVCIYVCYYVYVLCACLGWVLVVVTTVFMKNIHSSMVMVKIFIPNLSKGDDDQSHGLYLVNYSHQYIYI